MKKIYLALVIVICSVSFVNAQSRISFGATGGLFYGSGNFTSSGSDITSILELFDVTQEDLEVLEGGGFYAGFLADLKIFGDVHVQPELLYANAGGESILIAPILVKYYIADSFNLQVGPQFDLVLDIPMLAKELVNELGVSLALGAGFDINEKLSVQTKYTLGLNNRINNLISEATNGAVKPSLKTNVLLAGIVYKL